MIKIEIQKAPEFLYSEKVDLAIEKMDAFFASRNRSQKRYNWPFNEEIDKVLKGHLYKVFRGKCGYCETKIESSELGIVDRYRPFNGVRDKNEYLNDLYWWLTFEWHNLIYSCNECNQYKANYFPIDGERMVYSKFGVNTEIPLLLNPYMDNPEEHIEIDSNCNFLARTIKGEQTIGLLRLNREKLLFERRKLKERIDSIFIQQGPLDSDAKNFLYEYAATTSFYDEPHIFFGRNYISQLSGKEYFESSINREFPHGLENSHRSEVYRIDSSLLVENDYFPIEYIRIKNFKSIDDLSIDFKEDELNKKSWLFLLGENGVGKSSILQAIAIGLKLDRKIITSNQISSLIKRGSDISEIIVKERNRENTISTILDRNDSSIKQNGEFESYLIGYGSLRLSVDEIRNTSKEDTSNVSYANLFKPTKALNDVSKWLVSIYNNDIAFFNRIAYSIKLLLPHDKSNTDLSIKNGKIVLGDSETLFTELSDGYKSTITLAIDIMMKLSDAQSDMKVMSGIVLIDELGNQLHPRWQMRIVRQLREVFPNINFIVSTHHPLCLRGAERGEILLLRNLDNQVISNTELPDPASLRVDQILASEFFGLSSLVDPEIEAKFNRYYELLAKNNDIVPSERTEIDELKDFLRNKKQLGASLREELMYTVIDRLLAEKVTFNKKTFDRDSLKEEAVQRVKEVWKNLNLNTDD